MKNAKIGRPTAKRKKIEMESEKRHRRNMIETNLGLCNSIDHHQTASMQANVGNRRMLYVRSAD